VVTLLSPLEAIRSVGKRCVVCTRRLSSSADSVSIRIGTQLTETLHVACLELLALELIALSEFHAERREPIH
jgi:hypothetical protein